MPDMIFRPPHYCHSIETIDVIESWELGYHLGNAVKYISRAAHKGHFLEDLKKAQWYLARRISMEEQNARIQGEESPDSDLLI